MAGTVAAVNNNNTGIAGIAGGNGTSQSGVKLLSCQIFEHPHGNYFRDIVADNIGQAIKYGADNGAVICLNSWGYAVNELSRSTYIDPSHKAAIDYFIKYAGCDNDGNQLEQSPMKGGIVIFAVGNSNSDNPRVSAPADYEKVIAVASIGPDYKKARYSNYGDFVDICAPGGINNAEQGILSTTLEELGYYEYRHGTSMAAPHVAGVAALVIQKNGVGKKGFTANQLEEILLTTAYNIDEYNENFENQLGVGCISASAAIKIDTPSGAQLSLIKDDIASNILSFRVNSHELTGEAVIKIRSDGYTAMKKKSQRNVLNITILI